MKQAFLAHPKGLPDHEIDAAVARLEALFATTHEQWSVVSGRDDYKRRCAALGGWNGWARSVGAGPWFDLIVVFPDATIGKGTKSIVEAALAAGRRVVCWDGKRQSWKVRSIRALNDDNWKAGWLLLADGQKGDR